MKNLKQFGTQELTQSEAAKVEGGFGCLPETMHIYFQPIPVIRERNPINIEKIVRWA